MINRVQAINNINNSRQNFKGLRISDECLELLESAKLAHKRYTSKITPSLFREISERTQEIFHSDNIKCFRKILRRVLDMNTDVCLKAQKVVGDKIRFSLELKQSHATTKKVHLTTVSNNPSLEERANSSEQFLAKFEQIVNTAYAKENGITTHIKRYFSPDY